MTNQECWGLYEKQYDDHPLRLRLNESIEEYVCHPRYKNMVCVVIPLNDADENGFAYPEECKLLDELELVLRDRLEENQLSVFAAAVTSDGFRMYVTYTYHIETCEEIVNEVNKDWIYHDLSVTAQEDRNWEAIESLVVLQA